MRFFVRDFDRVEEYPDTPEELVRQIKMDSTNAKGKIRARAFFSEYFDNGGGVAHPQLGNLDNFRREMQRDWDYILNGINSVAAIIEQGLNGWERVPNPPMSLISFR